MSKKRELAAGATTELKYAIIMSIVTTILIVGLIALIWVLLYNPVLDTGNPIDIKSQMSAGHVDAQLIPVILVFILVFFAFPYVELIGAIKNYLKEKKNH